MRFTIFSYLFNSTDRLVHRFFKYSFFSLIDFFKYGFGYHAAAITFFTLMSLVPFFMVMTVIASYILNLNPDLLVKLVHRFFPSITQKFIDFILVLSNKRAIFGIAGFLIAFFFSTNIFTAMYTAFGYIFENKTSFTKSTFIRLFAIPVFILILIILYVSNLFLSTALDIITSFSLWKYLEKFMGNLHLNLILEIITNVSRVIQVLTYFIMVFFIYKFLTPSKSLTYREIFITSIVISFILYILKTLFAIYIIFSSKTNPIYGSLSGIFAFLAWLYVSYGTILFGGRILYYFEKDALKL
ncbi:MAG: hypothetical protein DSY66_01785 [Persephonella sp.]|nr:MAG: hypothetical protein DSY53_00310 [Persephonella sp.]RUM61599.1 MAG: hypothetical protein DSY66_01785 [Persephonella sp.]